MEKVYSLRHCVGLREEPQSERVCDNVRGGEQKNKEAYDESNIDPVDRCPGSDQRREFAFAPVRNELIRRDLLGALHPLGCHLESPRNDQRNDESCSYERHEHFHHPTRSFEGREQDRSCLDEQPRDDSVRDRDLVNAAPLQLGEEVIWVHYARLDEALVTGRTLR